MLARPGELPRSGGYSFEVKWDGFRAIVSTERDLEVRSRRGWNMTDLLPELHALPDGLVVDGELVAIADDGKPNFPLVSERILHGRSHIAVKLFIFDVLRVEGHDAMCLPYAERRALLEALELDGPTWATTPEAFNDGEALFEATLQLGLEGVVAKRLDEPYRPGERRWVKAKHRSYWRFGEETALARSARRRSAQSFARLTP